MMVSRVCVAVMLLMCALGGQTLELLRATATSGRSFLPSDPIPTPAVHCWCASYPNVTLCSWPEPPASPPTHYIATYSERHRQQVVNRCHLIPPGSSSSFLIPASSSSSERIWHCHLPNLKLLTDYIINVTAVYPGGSSLYLSSSMMEDIVKPDPPIDVRVSPLNLRSLMVEWSPPPTWTNLDIFPLKYQIFYQWENRGTPKSINLGPFESTKVELKGLTPGRVYEFQVCARELLGLGECSDWSSPVTIKLPRPKL